MWDPGSGQWWDTLTGQFHGADTPTQQADYLTRESAAEMVSKAVKEALGEFQQQSETSARLQAARAAEREAYDTVTTEVFGVQRNPREMSWLGRDGVNCAPL